MWGSVFFLFHPQHNFTTLPRMKNAKIRKIDRSGAIQIRQVVIRELEHNNLPSAAQKIPHHHRKNTEQHPSNGCNKHSRPCKREGIRRKEVGERQKVCREEESKRGVTSNEKAQAIYKKVGQRLAWIFTSASIFGVGKVPTSFPPLLEFAQPTAIRK
jgi:hypothetical protein